MSRETQLRRGDQRTLHERDDHPDDLSDTNADLSETDPALEDTVAEVELDEALDEIEPAVDGDHDAELEGGSRLLEGFDPEAHHVNVSRKVSVRGALSSEGGRFVIGLIVLALALGVIALAATIRTQAWYIAAGVVAPPALIWFFLRWKRWLAGAPYAYRLLTSLGEDADNLLDERRQKLLRRGVDPDADDPSASA